jgi:hypothetical protein
LSTLEHPVLVLKPQRSHAIDIIDRQEKVDGGERLVVLRRSGFTCHSAALGMIPEDDPARPPIRFGIGDCTMKN